MHGRLTGNWRQPPMLRLPRNQRRPLFDNPLTEPVLMNPVSRSWWRSSKPQGQRQDETPRGTRPHDNPIDGFVSCNTRKCLRLAGRCDAFRLNPHRLSRSVMKSPVRPSRSSSTSTAHSGTSIFRSSSTRALFWLHRRGHFSINGLQTDIDSKKSAEEDRKAKVGSSRMAQSR